ncbi:PEP/pyruvate-binding domain-containing protein [Thermopolyspora sp. NPDC052614]|uniref:PEP/pyruvate-binding domain-containing protein n=1 Tax=Thermopolyspora sp. NPDC052614 TaxID=3155682 RepID=UPI00343AF0BE
MIVALRDAVADSGGGKAGSLGTLLRAGLPVPDGFVIPFDVYRLALGDPRRAPSADPDAVRRAIQALALPDGLLGSLAYGLDRLGGGPVAVRSSAAGEDTARASAAGQHESVLAVHGLGAVADAVRTCWASLYTARAVHYRSASGEHPPNGEPAMAVLVQRLVDAEVSGVMFTPTRPDGPTEIEASWGLGPSVVGGMVTPDAYRVAADASVTRTVADKRIRLDRDGTRLVTRDVPTADRDRPSLDHATATRLALLGREVAAVLGGPQDIEWALADGRVWILQARPVTAAPQPAPRGAPAAVPATLRGAPGSRGTVTGTARVVRGPGDFARVRPGDILVCPHTDPSWTPLLRIASGVVTETGGVLSHAAIVARERRIPAVLGVPGATTRIRDDTTVTIDGAAGTITTGLTSAQESGG